MHTDCTLIAHLRIFLLFYRLLYCLILPENRLFFGIWKVVEIEVEIAQLPGSEELTVGQQVYLTNQYGQPFLVKVTDKDEKMITFDANHEMAGKELNFKIELVEVK